MVCIRRPECLRVIKRFPIQSCTIVHIILGAFLLMIRCKHISLRHSIRGQLLNTRRIRQRGMEPTTQINTERARTPMRPQSLLQMAISKVVNLCLLTEVTIALKMPTKPGKHPGDSKAAAESQSTMFAALEQVGS